MYLDLLPLTVNWFGARMTHETALEASIMNAEESFERFLPKVSLQQRKLFLQTALKELLWCQKNKVQVIPFFDPNYPIDFLNMHYLPPLICVQGSLAALNERDKLCVVGTRRPSLNILEWMDRELSEFAGKMRPVIVSGGAYGVDQKAHCIAIRKSLPTCCFIPSGLNNLYPKKLESLVDAIIANGGAIVSSYSPSTPMRKFHFAQRNYLMAAVGELCLILGAKKRSGTMITARASLENNKNLAVVPDFPSEHSAGSLSLIKEGAYLIENAQDLCDTYKKRPLRGSM